GGSPAANDPPVRRSCRQSQHAPAPKPRQTARTESPPAACAGHAVPSSASDQEQEAPCGRACRSPSAGTGPKQQTQTEPCSQVGAASVGSAVPPYPHSDPLPPPHRQPAACCQAHPRAQSPLPALHRPAASAPPQSRQAQSGTRGPSPDCRRVQGSPKPRPRASAPDPPCGTSGSPQAQTGPQQTAPPSAR